MALHKISRPTIWEAVIIGLAGLEGASQQAVLSLEARLREVFPSKTLQICRDGSLLGYSLLSHPTVERAVNIICGTGVSVSLVKLNRTTKQLELLNSVGGYGSLLGDDGSGYEIGRMAIRSTLRALDQLPLNARIREHLSPFYQAVLDHFGAKEDPSLLISQILSQNSSPFSRIASGCPVVFAHASDPIAKHILYQAAEGLAELIQTLFCSYKKEDASEMMFVSGGSVLQQEVYKNLLQDSLSTRGILSSSWLHVSRSH